MFGFRDFFTTSYRRNTNHSLNAEEDTADLFLQSNQYIIRSDTDKPAEQPVPSVSSIQADNQIPNRPNNVIK